MPIKPKRLSPGDVVGIIAPASPPPDATRIDSAISAVKRLGFRAKVAKNLRKRHGFLAGSDRERAGDLMRMFADANVRAIFCLRGGYGSARLLPYLDYGIIRANPKILLGYSDITALHCALLKKSNLVSFHGPMLNSELSREDVPEFTLNSLFRNVTMNYPSGSICLGYGKKRVRVLRRGCASGRLVGGNLSILCTTLGMPYQPSLRNSILYLEEVGEVPYRVDRLLTHLGNAGVLQQVNGIAIGLIKECKDPKMKHSREYRQTAEDVLDERLRPLGIPVVTGFPFGHDSFNATVPFGVTACLDADEADLAITEAAVR